MNAGGSTEITQKYWIIMVVIQIIQNIFIKLS